MYKLRSQWLRIHDYVIEALIVAFLYKFFALSSFYLSFPRLKDTNKELNANLFASDLKTCFIQNSHTDCGVYDKSTSSHHDHRRRRRHHSAWTSTGRRLVDVERFGIHKAQPCMLNTLYILCCLCFVFRVQKFAWPSHQSIRLICLVNGFLCIWFLTILPHFRFLI